MNWLCECSELAVRERSVRELREERDAAMASIRQRDSALQVRAPPLVEASLCMCFPAAAAVNRQGLEAVRSPYEGASPYSAYM